MLLRIRHETRYSYTEPIEYAAQLIRLTPGGHEGQRIVAWRVHEIARGDLPASDDGYGNILHMLTLNRMHQSATIVAEGEVETRETHGVVRGAVERFPAGFYLRPTAATAADAAMQDFLRGFAGVADPIERLHRAMTAIRGRIDYVTGTTSVKTTASEAFEQGRGVCQDHAHVFIACARALDFPARYVSGYLWHPADGEPQEASHAWAEAYVGDFGWIGFDPANAMSPTEAYVRVAVGLDYHAAAPIRGVWRGKADETLAVRIEVQQVQAQQ